MTAWFGCFLFHAPRGAGTRYDGLEGGTIMRHPRFRYVALLLACALATGCKDRHEPVKPTVVAAQYYFIYNVVLK
jgi:hypothetical protein